MPQAKSTTSTRESAQREGPVLGIVPAPAHYEAFPAGRDILLAKRIRWAANAPLLDAKGKSLGAPAKAVLTIIALHASNDGRARAWCSISTLAKMTSQSRATVCRALAVLHDWGWLAISDLPGKRRYRVPQSPTFPRCAECGFIWPTPTWAGIMPVECLSCGASEAPELPGIAAEVVSQ